MSVFVRKVDELGSIVLPMEFRKAINVDTKCEIELELRNGSMVLTPRQTICRFCGASIPTKTKYNLCQECIRAIKEDESVK